MTPLQVVYSIGVRFPGGGIGNASYYGVRGLYRHGMLWRLLCGSYLPTEIPDERIRALGALSRLIRKLALYDSTALAVLIHNLIYDRWVCRNLEPCELFYTWNGYGHKALRQARANGAITVVQRASSHPTEQIRLLQDEYARWGQRFSRPDRLVQRSVIELEEADYIVIPSDFVRDSFMDQGVDSQKLIQIPFGVDTKRFHPPDTPQPETPFRALFAGQIGIRKGVLYLLQAWEQLGWDDAELWLLGRIQSDFYSHLRPYRDLPGVRLLGHVGDMDRLFRQAHLFVFPTIEEGSALVVYDAMASGLPVITTPNAGSLIRDGEDGCLVPIRDVARLAEQIETMRTNQDCRRAYGQAGRARIEPFTWERHGDALAAALAEKR